MRTRAFRPVVASIPIRNYAQSPRFAGFSTIGGGRFANDRFPSNVTYTDVSGATDGPTLKDGTTLTRYGRLSVNSTGSRSKLGFNVAQNPEDTSPTISKQIPCTPGETIYFRLLGKTSSTAAIYAVVRGSDGVSAWVDTLSGAGSASFDAGAWEDNDMGKYVVPTGVYKFALAFYATGSLPNNATFDVAAMDITRVPAKCHTDGFFPDSRWVGAANASDSINFIPITQAPITNPWVTSSPTLLTWAPPFNPKAPPSGTRIVVVDDTFANRHISLNDGQDCLLIMPSTAVSDIEQVRTYEALITVEGGRHVVVVGGWIHINKTASTKLTTAMASGSAANIVVGSTAGFPTVGMLRIDGESISYTGKTSTTFTGVTRNNGYYNDSDVSSQTTHAVNADVYISERHRSAIAFNGQTGMIHVEGLLIDGFVCDGVRFSDAAGASLRLQRCRIQDVTNYDLVYETDGHPDAIQAYGNAVHEVDMDQVSMVLGANGNGIINKGTDGSTNSPVAIWRYYNCEIVSPDGKARSLVANTDGTKTTWYITNGWLRYDPALNVVMSSGTGIRASFQEKFYKQGQLDIVPAASVGLGYVSPGYASNLPAGYALLKSLDLTNSTGWEVREGQTKDAGIMRAANVTFSPTGIRLRAGRIGGELSSSELRGNVGTTKTAPNFCYTRTELSYDPLVGGTWPSVWRRGLSPSGNGELDDWELFGATAHANMHTTPYGGTTERQAWRSGLPTFQGTAGGSHVIETLLTPDGFSVWWDGKFVNKFTPADFNANAVPTTNSTLWSPQFDTSTETWQIILSNQISSSYAGGPPSGAYTWDLYITKYDIYTLAA